MLNIRQLFTREGFEQGLQSLHTRSPMAILILASSVAGLGYALLGLFPLLTLLGYRIPYIFDLNNGHHHNLAYINIQFPCKVE